MFKNARLAVVLLLITAVAAVMIISDISAQTFRSASTFHQGHQQINDYSNMSTNGAVRSSFTINAEVVETASSTGDGDSDESHGNLMGLMVSPRQLVFDETNMTGQLTITNIGAIDTVFRIEFVNTVTDAEGNKKIIDTGLKHEISAGTANEQRIRFAPRMVRLAAKEQQIIRVAARLFKKTDPKIMQPELLFRWSADIEELVSKQQLARSLTSTNDAIEPEDSKQILIPLIFKAKTLPDSDQLSQNPGK